MNQRRNHNGNQRNTQNKTIMKIILQDDTKVVL